MVLKRNVIFHLQGSALRAVWILTQFPLDKCSYFLFYLGGTYPYINPAVPVFPIAEDVRGHNSGPVALQRWMGPIYSSAAASFRSYKNGASLLCSGLLFTPTRDVFPGAVALEKLPQQICPTSVAAGRMVEMGNHRWDAWGLLLESGQPMRFSLFHRILLVIVRGKKCLHHLKHHLKPCCSEHKWEPERMGRGGSDAFTDWVQCGSVTSTCASTWKHGRWNGGNGPADGILEWNETPCVGDTHPEMITSPRGRLTVKETAQTRSVLTGNPEPPEQRNGGPAA